MSSPPALKIFGVASASELQSVIHGAQILEPVRRVLAAEHVMEFVLDLVRQTRADNPRGARGS